MKAIVCHNDGSPDVLQYEDIEKPIAGDNQVLIKVRAASVNPLDGFPILIARISRIMVKARLLKPTAKRLGADVAGEVEAVGKNVAQFKPGDEVFGVCNGAFAEYVRASEKNLVLKPAKLSFEEAAAVPVAAVTALQGLRDYGGIRPGQKVLVDGASGGVGTFAIQIAKSFEAEVTAVCSTRNVAIAQSLGADQVIDYTREDFTRGEQHYDLIIGANAHHSIFSYRRVLTRDGIYVMLGGGLFEILQVFLLRPLLSRISGKKVHFFIANINQKDLAFLRDLLETGKIASIIDRHYPLSNVAEAIRYREEGHAQGKIIITI